MHFAEGLYVGTLCLSCLISLCLPRFLSLELSWFYRSDGYWDEWEAARSVYESLFGEEPKCPWGEGDDVREDEEWAFAKYLIHSSGCVSGLKAVWLTRQWRRLLLWLSYLFRLRFQVLRIEHCSFLQVDIIILGSRYRSEIGISYPVLHHYLPLPSFASPISNRPIQK